MTDDETLVWELEELLVLLDELYYYREHIMFLVGGDRSTIGGLTKEILEEHLDKIIDYIESTPSRACQSHRFPSNPNCFEYIRQMRIINDDIIMFYHMLGILILQTGAVLPDRVKKAIIEKDYLKGFEGFKKRIREYTPGHPLEKIRDIVKREKRAP